MELQIDVELLRKNKLFLATPMYGGQSAGMFAKSTADLTAIFAQHQIPLTVHYLFNESLITRARNYCCDEFMRSDCQHMFFLDSDIGFNPHDVIGLMGMQAQNEQYDIIGAPYPKKCISWEKIKHAVDRGVADKDPEILSRFVGDFVFNPINSGNIPLGEPAEVLEIGTGFMMVSRKALEKFRDSYPQYSYRPDHVRTKHFDGSREIMMYFQAEVDGLDFGAYYQKEFLKLAEQGDIKPEQVKEIIDKAWELHNKKSKRYLSEDYWFCQKAREIGLRTWLCPWMQLFHVGTYIFGGSLADLASIGAAATADPSKLGKK